MNKTWTLAIIVLGLFTLPVFAEDDDAVHEITQHREQYQQTIRPMVNAAQAFTGGAAAAANPANPYAAPTPTQSPSPFQGLENLNVQQIMDNPWVKKYVNFISNPIVLEGIRKLGNHPDRRLVIYYEIAWLLFMFTLRTWRNSKIAPTEWRKIIWLRFWTFVVQWSGVLWFIPNYVFGQPYREVLGALWKALSG